MRHFFLVLPAIANAQVWVSSGFKAGADAQHETAYCSTSAVDPKTGVATKTASDYVNFTAVCEVTSSAGSTISSNLCPMFAFPDWGIEPGFPFAGNPTGVCTLSFQKQPGLTYTVNATHSLAMFDLGWGGACTQFDNVCYSDPQGFMNATDLAISGGAPQTPTGAPAYSSEGSSMTKRLAGTGVSQVLSATDHFPDIVLATTSAQYPRGPAIDLQRIDLMNIEATGTPEGGTFSFDAQPDPGTTNAGIDFASRSSSSTNPTTLQLSDPDNPCMNQVPCPGGLEDITVHYAISGRSAKDDFKVPTFGMSCYDTTLESDFGTPPNACLSETLFKVKYSGTVTDPGSLKGTFCKAFIEDVLLNAGSGILNNGTAVQKVNGSIGPTPDGKIHTADGPVPIPDQTVARDRKIIPRKKVLIDLDQVGTGLHADDTGKKGYITGYRLDLYMGLGNAVCAGYDAIMAVGACTPATTGCPASAIQ